MNIKSVDLDGGVLITLSSRNLTDLYLQWERWGNAELHRMTPNGFVRVVVEPDIRHYANRLAGPGSGLLPDRQAQPELDDPPPAGYPEGMRILTPEAA